MAALQEWSPGLLVHFEASDDAARSPRANRLAAASTPWRPARPAAPDRATPLPTNSGFRDARRVQVPPGLPGQRLRLQRRCGRGGVGRWGTGEGRVCERRARAGEGARRVARRQRLRLHRRRDGAGGLGACRLLAACRRSATMPAAASSARSQGPSLSMHARPRPAGCRHPRDGSNHPGRPARRRARGGGAAAQPTPRALLGRRRGGRGCARAPRARALRRGGGTARRPPRARAPGAALRAPSLRGRPAAGPACWFGMQPPAGASQAHSTHPWQ